MKQLMLGVAGAVLVLAVTASSRAGDFDNCVSPTFNGTPSFDATKASLKMSERWSEINSRYLQQVSPLPVELSMPTYQVYYRCPQVITRVLTPATARQVATNLQSLGCPWRGQDGVGGTYLRYGGLNQWKVLYMASSTQAASVESELLSAGFEVSVK